MITKRKILRTLTAALGFFFLMMAWYIIKTTRKPMINRHIGSHTMPYFYAANALVSLLGIFLYNFAVNRFPRTNLLRVFFGGIVGCFFVLWGIINLDYSPGSFPAQIVASIYFFFVCLYHLFCVALFWSFNHDIHASDEAEKLYPYINLGAQIGAITGSIMMQKWLAQYGQYLLPITIANLVLCWISLEILKNFDPNLEKNRYAKPKNTGAIHDLKLFVGNRYIMCLGLIVVLASFVPTLGDLHVNWIVDNTLIRNDNSALWQQKDFKDLPALAEKLHSAEDPLSKHLAQKLSEKTKRALTGSDFKDEHSQKILIDDLNNILQSGSLYQEKRFEKIELTHTRRKQIKQNLQGEDLVMLNRVLLEEAYYKEIKNSQSIGQKKFWSGINKYASLCNIVMCLVITPFLFSIIGPAWSICLYPLALLVGAILFLQNSTLQIISYFVIASYTLKYTLYNMGQEVFFVPTDKNIKYKIKAICETFLFRFGDALSSGIIAILGVAFAVGISITMFGSFMVWIPVIFYTGSLYQKRIEEQEQQKQEE